MKTNINALLLVLVAEATIQALAKENEQLREHVAGHDRLRTAHGQLKGRIAELENRVASADETTRQYWTMIQNGNAEVRQLKEKLERFRGIDRYYGSIERQNEELQEECGRLRVSADALEERANLTEQQLAAADAHIKELEAALVLASLPADSRNTVIQMAKVAA